MLTYMCLSPMRNRLAFVINHLSYSVLREAEFDFNIARRIDQQNQ